jgi:hypothetical protein
MVNAAELNGDRAGDQGTTTETHHRQSGHQAIIASPVTRPSSPVRSRVRARRCPGARFLKRVQPAHLVLFRGRVVAGR